MPFSYRHFLRQVPAQTIRDFLASRGVDVDETVDWQCEEPRIARQLADAIDALDDDSGAEIIADFERASLMSDERGYTALLNAAPDQASLAQRLADLENSQERALRVLIDDEGLFRAAEEIRYFDYYIDRSQGRRFQAQAGLALARTEEALNRLGSAMGTWFRKRDGSGQYVVVEVIERYGNGSIQATLYIEDVPSNRAEFERGQLRRRPSRPAKEAAVVYVPETGHLETVVRGGKPIHEALRDAFAQYMLGISAGGDLVQAQELNLQHLLVERVLPVNRANGVKKARVRRLKLEPPRKGHGSLLIDTPPWEDSPSAYDFLKTWLPQFSPVDQGFKVMHVTISLHFDVPSGRRPKALHIELTHPNTSNTKNFGRADRDLAERCLRDWGIDS